MKKKYYKQIIQQLEEKLDDQKQRNRIVYNRMVAAEESNKALRNDLAQLSKQIFDEIEKNIIKNFNQKL